MSKQDQLVSVTLGSRVVATTSVASETIGAEAAVVDMDSGTYYGVQGAGVLIWEALREPVALSDVHTLLMRHFEIDAGTCERELLSFIEDLVRARLVRIVD